LVCELLCAVIRRGPAHPSTTTWLFREKGRTVRERESSIASEIDMAKGEQKSNRETKKPKKDKIKTIAAAPSQKTGGWQPTVNTGKKK
jgi:hypothetical protein